MSLFQIAYSQSFSDELKMFTKGKLLKPFPNLSSFSPFLDWNGIIRGGGWLSHYLFYDKKHPIIFSGKHHPSKFIVTWAFKIVPCGSTTFIILVS